MGPWSRVRVAKCQMLVTCFFILVTAAGPLCGHHGDFHLLRGPLCCHSPSVPGEEPVPGCAPMGMRRKKMARADLTTQQPLMVKTLRRASCASRWRSAHRCSWCSGDSTAPPRAHQSLTGFNLGIPVQQGPAGSTDSGKDQRAQAAGTRNVEVEDAMLDTYDLVYEQAMKGMSHVGRQELAAIQDTFLCCGKRSPFSRLGSTEADLCQGQEAAREDCLQGIRSFLRIHQQVASSLTSISLALTVSALLLSSFLWFAIRSGCSLDRKGQYTLAPRACGRQPQEPSVFRRSQGGPAHCLRSEADAIDPRRYSGSLRWLQDSDAAPGPLSHHLPAHRGEDAPAVSPHGIPEGRVRAVRRGVSEGPAREPASIGNRRKGRSSSPNPSMGTGRVQAQRKPRWRQQPRADLQTRAVHALEGSTQTQAATVFYAV
ncbi:tetraspanin-32 isoform X1 [Macaca fascicularis]|uniref:tetraspanin-32 isoform X1 n=2 Tax=Macaca fascicularis TaxID=9541 RepID=UPI0032B04802